LRSLLPDRGLVVNEYIRIPPPALEAPPGLECLFDTSDSIPTDRNRLVHKAYQRVFVFTPFRLSLYYLFRTDMVRCTFLSTAVWFTLLSFYNVAGDLIQRKRDIKLYPTEEAVLNSNGSAQEVIKEVKQVKIVCGNCKKQQSDFPDRTFKSCGKCRAAPSKVMYCSR
jgi:hypothetical protein